MPRRGYLGFLLLLVISGCARDPLDEGLAAHQAKKHEEAVVHLQRAVKENPRQLRAWQALIQSSLALGRHEEALRAANQALAVYPQTLSLLLLKGKALGALERHKEALEVYSEVLALDPTHTEALKERAEAFIQEGDLPRAYVDVKQAVAFAPQDPWAHHKLGMVEFALGRYEEAVKALGTAIRLAPDSPLFYFSRGQIYLRHLNRRAEAIADFQKGCELGHHLCCQELEHLGLAGKQP